VLDISSVIIKRSNTMQQKLKDAIGFEHFWTAYGPRGAVAMAWWLGAQHASRIRREHGSFPLLHVAGGPGTGKTFLLRYLQKLQGQETYQACAPEYASCIGRARLLAQLDRQVLIYEVSGERSGTFDWTELLQLYSGGSFAIRPKNGLPLQVQFRGALVVCANAPTMNGLEQRLIHVDLPGFQRSQRVNDSLDALAQIEADEVTDFTRLARQHEWEIFDIFTSGAAAYSAALSNDYGDEIGPRQIRNYGQLMALVDCLCLMLDLPNERRLFIQQEVQDMALFETLPI
jgi:hypothetical protein